MEKLGSQGPSSLERQAAVVGGDHHNTLAVVRSLGLAGFRVSLVVIAQNGKSFVTHSRYVDAFRIIPNENEIEAALSDLFDLETEAERSSGVPIICTSDGAAVSVDKSDWLRKYFLCPGIRCEDFGKLSSAMDKFAMSQFASASRFSVPETFRVNFENGIPEVPCGLEFPCIIKPEKSFLGSKNDFRICPIRKLWKETLMTLDSRHEFVCQPFLPVDAEGQVLGVRNADGRCFFAGTTHKPLCCPKTSNLGMAIIAEFSPDAFRFCSREMLERLLEKSGYFGPFSVEFIVSGGKVYFVEINFRTDGNFYLSLAGGVNLPAIWCGDVRAQNFSACSVTGLVEISYLKYTFLKNPIRGIVDFFRADAFAIFDKTDPKPMIFKILNQFFCR